MDDPDVAKRLEGAYSREGHVLALEIAYREVILRALDDPPSNALAPLRGVLLEEHMGRVRDGLV